MTRGAHCVTPILKRYLSRTENRDAPVNDKVTPAQIAAIGEWGTVRGERFAYLKNITDASACAVLRAAWG